MHLKQVYRIKKKSEDIVVMLYHFVGRLPFNSYQFEPLQPKIAKIFILVKLFSNELEDWPTRFSPRHFTGSLNRLDLELYF